MTSIADQRGIFFSTGKAKNVFNQIVANPAVELCFYEQATERQLRITASTEQIDNPQIKSEIINKFPFLKPWIEQVGMEQMGVFHLISPKGLLISSSGPEEQRQSFKF